MTHNTRSESYIHPAAEMYATELKSGLLDRREFLSRTTALGLSASAACALGGLATPALAGGHMKQGGTIRFQMEVRALKDPRAYDWTQIATYTAGWLEYLVEYNNDGDQLHIEALSNVTLLFGHAKPFDEPVVARGPFVMNTEEEIEQAYQDYQDGKLGKW